MVTSSKKQNLTVLSAWHPRENDQKVPKTNAEEREAYAEDSIFVTKLQVLLENSSDTELFRSSSIPICFP